MPALAITESTATSSSRARFAPVEEAQFRFRSLERVWETRLARDERRANFKRGEPEPVEDVLHEPVVVHRELVVHDRESAERYTRINGLPTVARR